MQIISFLKQTITGKDTARMNKYCKLSRPWILICTFIQLNLV